MKIMMDKSVSEKWVVHYEPAQLSQILQIKILDV